MAGATGVTVVAAAVVMVAAVVVVETPRFLLRTAEDGDCWCCRTPISRFHNDDEAISTMFTFMSGRVAKKVSLVENTQGCSPL